MHLSLIGSGSYTSCAILATHTLSFHSVIIYTCSIVPVRYRDLDQVVAFINARDKPLVLYGFTDDATVRDRLKNETSSGACVFNDTL